MTEVWAQIEDAPNYSVSTLGRVRRSVTIKGRPAVLDTLRLRVDGRGYTHVTLYTDGKKWTRSVHRLVLDAFGGPRPTPEHECAHQDGNKLNNSIDNLRWATRTENSHDKHRHGTTAKGTAHGKSKLNDAIIREIRTARANGALLRTLADRFGVSETTISTISRGGTWAHVQPVQPLCAVMAP